MSINFPNLPTVGQLWPNPAQAGLPVYQWDGEKWLTTPTPAASVASFSQFEFTATAGQTTFSGLDIYGATLAYSAGYISVFVNGDRINKADFVGTNGTSIVFAIGRILNDQVTIVALSTAPIANVLMNSNNLSDLASIATARANLGVVGSVKVQKFTASGTYTPSAGLLYAIIECVGSGGGGGAVTGTAGQIYAGGGGGSGSYSRRVVSAATIGASQAVTIGAAGNGGVAGNNTGTAGGDVSVGALCIGKGGAGGIFGSSTSVALGGAGGPAGTGDITAAGAPGQGGFYNSANGAITAQMGAGGSSIFGGGAPAVGNNVAGSAASNYGSGGSGASIGGAANLAGGNGSAGIAIITEYCTQ